jgi:glutathione S-transferase
VLRIWGRSNSINVQKVVWCCGELGIPYERIEVGDGGFVLWESNAIVRYLAAKHGMGTLCPEDLAQRADADRWMDWQMGTLWANLRPAFIELIRMPPETRDQAHIAASIGKTSETWAMLDAHLATRDYVTGPAFTMADIPLGVTAYRWFSLDIERPPMRNLEAWYESLCARSLYKTNVMLPLS